MFYKTLFHSPIFTNIAKEIIIHKNHYLLFLIFHEYYVLFEPALVTPTTDMCVCLCVRTRMRVHVRDCARACSLEFVRVGICGCVRVYLFLFTNIAIANS